MSCAIPGRAVMACWKASEEQTCAVEEKDVGQYCLFFLRFAHSLIVIPRASAGLSWSWVIKQLAFIPSHRYQSWSPMMQKYFSWNMQYGICLYRNSHITSGCWLYHKQFSRLLRGGAPLQCSHLQPSEFQLVVYWIYFYASQCDP